MKPKYLRNWHRKGNFQHAEGLPERGPDGKLAILRGACRTGVSARGRAAPHNAFEKENRAVIDANDLQVPSPMAVKEAFVDCKPGDEIEIAYSIVEEKIRNAVPYPCTFEKLPVQPS